jgi:hypothetical protein
MGQYAYLRVRFPGTERGVYMDGGPKSIGPTNKRLRVRKMFHEFDLGPQQDYTPAIIGLRVEGGPSTPTTIEFAPVTPAPPDDGGDGGGA